MEEYYKLYINDEIERDLPIVEIEPGLKIAGFDCIGDNQLLDYASDYLKNVLKSLNIDCIITTEVKGIPIAQELSRKLGIDYVCLRKQKKVYMGYCIEFKGNSITSGESSYFISRDVASWLYDKNILFVDDVYSTGSTMDLIEVVCDYFHCNLVGGAFILREVDDINVGGQLVFKHNNIKCNAIELVPLIKE